MLGHEYGMIDIHHNPWGDEKSKDEKSKVDVLKDMTRVSVSESRDEKKPQVSENGEKRSDSSSQNSDIDDTITC
jgi:hypothetical protein